MRTVALLVLAAVLVIALGAPLAGCKRRKQKSAAEVSVPGLPSTQQPVATDDLEMLNQAFANYIQIGPEPPSDIAAELYRMKLIPRLPAPPPDKRYVVDKKNGQVVLINR